MIYTRGGSSPPTVCRKTRRVDTFIELELVSVGLVRVYGLPHPFRRHHLELWVVPYVIEYGHVFLWDLELVRQCLK